MFFFSFQTQRIFEITIREVGEVQPQDYSYVQLLNILVRKVMEKMELAQVDRHYFDPKAAVHLKEYRLELWVSTDFLNVCSFKSDLSWIFPSPKIGITNLQSIYQCRLLTFFKKCAKLGLFLS